MKKFTILLLILCLALSAGSAAIADEGTGIATDTPSFSVATQDLGTGTMALVSEVTHPLLYPKDRGV